MINQLWINLVQQLHLVIMYTSLKPLENLISNNLQKCIYSHRLTKHVNKQFLSPSILQLHNLHNEAHSFQPPLPPSLCWPPMWLCVNSSSMKFLALLSLGHSSHSSDSPHQALLTNSPKISHRGHTQSQGWAETFPCVTFPRPHIHTCCVGEKWMQGEHNLDNIECTKALVQRITQLQASW